jgi:lysine decarboxylase
VLRRVPGLVLPDRATFGPRLFDDAKLVVLTAGAGVDGLAVDRDLAAAGFALEMADRDLLVPMLTTADGDDAVSVLAEAMATAMVAAIDGHRGEPRPVVAHAAWTVAAEQVLAPREAFFAEREAVPWAEAPGRVCAEVVAPYPPGVPVLAPGERITSAALDALQEARAAGARIAYAADPTLATVLAVRTGVGGGP